MALINVWLNEKCIMHVVNENLHGTRLTLSCPSQAAARLIPRASLSPQTCPYTRVPATSRLREYKQVRMVELSVVLVVFPPAMPSALISPFALLLSSLALIWQLVHLYRRLSASYKHGCLPAVRLPQSPWRLGSDIQAQMAAIQRSGHVTRSLQSLFDQHGRTFQATIWGQPWLFTCDVENIKAINTTCFPNFGVEPLRKFTNTGWMGDGIFVSDGDHWRMSRSLFKPLFARTGEVHLNALQRQISVLFDVLPANGETVDLQTIFRRMVR